MKAVPVCLLTIACFAAMTGGCSQTMNVRSMPETFGGMTIDYQWSKENLCERGYSPRIVLQGIPEGTVRFKAKLKDLNMPSFMHGGGEAPNDGSGFIPAGALKSYHGPCPPLGRVHRYSFSVQALDSSGKVLALAEKTVECDRMLLK